MKKCKRCGERKHLTRFWEVTQNKSGRDTVCAACRDVDLWRATIDHHLQGLGCPRVLCDMPAGVDGALNTWYSRRVRAYVVAVCLCALPWGSFKRATLVREWSQPNAEPVRVLRQLQMSLPMIEG